MLLTVTIFISGLVMLVLHLEWILFELVEGRKYFSVCVFKFNFLCLFYIYFH